MTPHVFGLYGEELYEFRDSLDELIRKLIITMQEKDLEEGAVNAKLKISVKHGVGSGAGPVTMMQIEPTVSLKIGASAKAVLKKETGIFLQFDDNGMPVVGSHQMEISEYIRAVEKGA